MMLNIMVESQGVDEFGFPELILEEVEGGFLIINWEATAVEGDFFFPGDEEFFIEEYLGHETEQASWHSQYSSSSSTYYSSEGRMNLEARSYD